MSVHDQNVLHAMSTTPLTESREGALAVITALRANTPFGTVTIFARKNYVSRGQAQGLVKAKGGKVDASHRPPERRKTRVGFDLVDYDVAREALRANNCGQLPCSTAPTQHQRGVGPFYVEQVAREIELAGRIVVGTGIWCCRRILPVQK